MNARKHYKYIVLNSTTSEQTEELLNAAAAEGFTVEHVIQGFKNRETSWRYPAVVMSKDAEPVTERIPDQEQMVPE